MKSEDIAYYVAGLEAEVERLRASKEADTRLICDFTDQARRTQTELLELRTNHVGLSAYGDTPIGYIRELEAKVAEVQRERNEARAEVERLRAAQHMSQIDFDEKADIIHVLRSANADLSAALPVLPDVGPVTRDDDGTIQVDGYDFVDCELPHDPEVIRAAVARTLAVAAFLDAEAADTSSADEVRELAAVMHAADCPPDGKVRSSDPRVESYYDLACAVLAHRAARTSDEQS